MSELILPQPDAIPPGMNPAEKQANMLPKSDWLIEPGKRIETPVDDRGFVIAEALVAEVVNLAPEGYDWGDKENLHHEYWISHYYKPTYNGDRQGELLRYFRNIGYHHIVLPVAFHNFTHHVTRPVLPPSIYHVENRVRAWETSSMLFNQLSRLKHLAYNPNPDLFEENYDDELTAEERISMICQRLYETSIIDEVLSTVQLDMDELIDDDGIEELRELQAATRAQDEGRILDAQIIRTSRRHLPTRQHFEELLAA